MQARGRIHFGTPTIDQVLADRVFALATDTIYRFAAFTTHAINQPP
jgi:hypothetical protein